MTPTLLSHLRRVRRARTCRCGLARWTALCPAHDDREPSLVVTLAVDGKVLLWCNAGCSAWKIVAALGLHMRDLTPGADERSERPSQGAWQDLPKAKPVAFYEYRGERGDLLYRVVRTEPKGFYQERWDGQRWRCGLADVRRVLYRLPDVLAQPRQPVLIPEGEKDVDRLWSLGLCATCNAMGTAGGWCEAYSRSLAGRRCVVLPDNDPPGLEHGWAVVGSLMQYGAASVRIVLLPGLPPKGDVSDYLDAGFGREQLVRTIKAAPEWVPGKGAVGA